jgi:predicted secreted protein
MKALFFAFSVLIFSYTTLRASEQFLISYWHGPEPDPKSFAEIAEANFNVAMCGGGVKALELAKANGLKVMIIDSRITAKTPEQEGFEEGLDTVIADYAKHPALWGYYVTDEPNSSQFENLGAINQYLLKKDPKHIPFINLFPTYASQEQLGNPTYEEHVSSFAKTVKPVLLSYDHYALIGDRLRQDYFENMEIIRREGLKQDVPFNFILLSVPHFGYRDPSEGDLRWQVNTALAYGARGIMYFTYSSLPDTESYKGWGDAIIARDGSRTAKYAWVKQINGEVRKMSPILMELTSTEVYHTQPLPRGTVAIPKDDVVAGIEGGGFVVGHFRSRKGDNYTMFVNRDPRSAAEAVVRFSGRIRLEEVERTTGGSRPVRLEGDGGSVLWKASFSPGQARLVKVLSEERKPAHTLTEKDSGGSFEMAPGETLAVRLDENPTTGYGWAVVECDKDVLSLERSEFVSSGGKSVGVGGVRVFVFEAEAVGSTSVRLSYRREWEGEKSAAGRFVFKVAVKGK